MRKNCVSFCFQFYKMGKLIPEVAEIRIPQMVVWQPTGDMVTVLNNVSCSLTSYKFQHVWILSKTPLSEHPSWQPTNARMTHAEGKAPIPQGDVELQRFHRMQTAVCPRGMATLWTQNHSKNTTFPFFEREIKNWEMGETTLDHGTCSVSMYFVSLKSWQMILHLSFPCR